MTRTTSHYRADHAYEAASIIRNGGLVVFPTETVYGLGANALDGLACTRIFQAKGRPADNPLIVHFPDLASLRLAFPDLPEKAHRLFAAFSPGPLSVIVPKALAAPAYRISDEATAGLDTVALRIPRHPVARQLLRHAGVPVAAPSANRSGRPSPTTFDMACSEMDGRADAIIDGGQCDIGLESTVVDLTGDEIRILRHGATTTEMIVSVLGAIATNPQLAHSRREDGRPRSPGLKYTHYKPRATVVVSEQSLLDISRNAIVAASLKFGHRAGPVGIIRIGEHAETYNMAEEAEGTITAYVQDDKEYARSLYRLLIWFDANNVDVVIAELPDAHGVGMAVRDRLQRASGGNRLDVSP